MAKLTVITSIFNAEKYLKDALESGINQTIPFNWILLDDGSTDKSRKIAYDFLSEKLKNHSWFIEVDDKNKGQAARYNQGVLNAKTEYIAYLDADDLSKHRRLETQIKFLDENPDIWCVGSHAVVIGPEDNWIGEYNHPPEKHENIVKFILKERYSPMLHPTVMFRKSGFLGYDLEKPVNYLCDDLDLWCRSIISGLKFANIPSHLIYYRKHPTSLSERFSTEIYREAQRIIDKYKDSLWLK